MYESLGVVLFAIAIPKRCSSATGQSVNSSYDQSYCEEGNAKNYMVLINPGDYIVKGDEIGFIIASDSALADGVSNYKRSGMKTQNHDNISSGISERQPLLSSKVLKSNLSDDTKKRSDPSTTQDQQYPYKPDSNISHRHRAFSTSLIVATDGNRQHRHQQ